MGDFYLQTFDTLAVTGTSTTLPAGWYLAESGTNANAEYTAGTGSATAGDTYSFGSSGRPDRALGGLLSASLIPTIGACFTNATGSAISSLSVAYVGEQWRLGALAREDRLDFQYSTDATSLTTGAWTNVDSLDFTAPVTTGTVGPLDGNVVGNQTLVQATINLSIPDGATFWIRWTDFNASGADDGLAVDNFSLTPYDTAAVDVLSFTADRGDAGVTLAWQTGTEVSCGAFKIARCDRDAGACGLADHQELDLTVACEDNPAGASYTITDATAVPGVTYSYFLHEYGTAGGVEKFGAVLVQGFVAVEGTETGAQGCAIAGTGNAASALAGLLLLALVALRRRSR